MAQAVKTLMTAEGLAGLPDDGAVRRELVRGEVTEMGPASQDHSTIAWRISHLLGLHVVGHNAGAITVEGGGYVLARDPDTVRAPDVGFVAKKRLPEGRPARGFFEGAPDLAVEVVSPGDTAHEVEAKVVEYLEAGSSLVWVVYPDERMVRVHRSLAESFLVNEGGVLSGDPVLSGLAIPVAAIFEE